MATPEGTEAGYGRTGHINKVAAYSPKAGARFTRSGLCQYTSDEWVSFLKSPGL